MAPDAKPSFWQTLPGLITAFAGLLTAVGGLIVVLMQLGVIGKAEPQPRSSASPVAVLAPNSAASAAVRGSL